MVLCSRSPVVSVILCTYDPDLYQHFVDAAESVLGQSYERVELVVVVDGSVSLYEQVRDDYADLEAVVVHRNPENVGLLESRNTGVTLASGEVVAFIDDDAVADEAWLSELVGTYRDTDAIAAGGRMVAEWVAGQPSFLPDEFLWLVGVTHEGFAEGQGEVRNTFGSNLSFLRERFLDLGGFNPAIGGRTGKANLQGGETELCARMATATGRGVRYNPNAVVAHKVFAYRTRPGWLVDRAFWQGYSKRAMQTLLPEPMAGETAFLRYLLAESVPRRLGRLLRRPSKTEAAQLVFLIVLTVAVGSGYLYGSLRWR